MRLKLCTKLMLLAWILFFTTISFAQDVPAAPTTQSADSVESKIRSALPALAKNATGTPAINALSELRDPKVLNVFKHIDAGRLYNYKDAVVVVYNDGKDKPQRVYDLFVDLDENNQPMGAAIETAAPGTIDEKSVLEVARPVQKLIGNSLLVLGLKVNDAKIRRSAARDIGNKRVVAALPELRNVATSDADAKVRHEAEESVAMIVASGVDTTALPADRASAVAKLGELGSIRGLSLLKELQGATAPIPELTAPLSQSIQQIQRHITITDWIKNIFFGLSAGSIFVLLALGLAITFGLMGVINMAHGEMLMIGAITTWATFEFISPILPEAYFDWYYIIALPLSFTVAGLAGLLVEVTIVRHLYKRPLDSLLATIGVSFVLIQAVRLWKGDNLGMRGPSWANRSIEIFQDVILPYNRLFLILLCIFCVLMVVGIFRYTRLGLMIRATIQNREMAQACGVNTRLVDMFTFAFGAGLAGLAGYGIVLTANPTPDMGQSYIVKTFLTVVVGGVGKLAGVVWSGLGIGFIEKLLEPIVLIEKPLKIFDATWAQVATLLLVILFMQRRPGGLFPDKGRMADQADKTAATAGGKMKPMTEVLLGVIFIVLGLGLVPLLYGTGAVSPEFVNKLGYIFAFAICAIGLDLIWGYIGVLSLCQFLFFSLGGYCMGLYLVNYGPKTGDGIPDALARVMSDVKNPTAPWFLHYFESFPIAVFLGLLLPGLVAMVIGLTTFRSRVRGVYFSILTQAITVAAWLIFQKNDLKLGGTNGLTDFKTILGYSIQGNAEVGLFGQTRFWLYIVSFIVMMLAIVATRFLVLSGFGRVLVAIRDDETRLRFVGYQTWAYKAAAFTIAAILGAVGGMLYVPQKGIITPSDMAAGTSILVVAWVAVGGRGTVWGAVIGAISVSLLYDFLTSWEPDYWPYAIGGLFIVVPLLLPGGVMSLPSVISKLMNRAQATSNAFESQSAPKTMGGR